MNKFDNYINSNYFSLKMYLRTSGKLKSSVYPWTKIRIMLLAAYFKAIEIGDVHFVNNYQSLSVEIMMRNSNTAQRKQSSNLFFIFVLIRSIFDRYDGSHNGSISIQSSSFRRTRAICNSFVSFNNSFKRIRSVWQLKRKNIETKTKKKGE